MRCSRKEDVTTGIGVTQGNMGFIRKATGPAKGEKGYISQVKKRSVIISALCLAWALALFIAGLFIFDSRANILTIVAAVLIIPFSQFVTHYILFAKFKSVSDELVEKVENTAKPGSIMYVDTVITSTERAMNLCFIIITGEKLIALDCAGDKKYEKTRDYIRELVKKKGYSYKVIVEQDEEKFFRELRNSDSVLDIKFANDDEKEEFEKDRADLCAMLETYMA